MYRSPITFALAALFARFGSFHNAVQSAARAAQQYTVTQISAPPLGERRRGKSNKSSSRPSGAAAHKRAATRRRNIAKRPRSGA